jgi:hypothetical protein
MKTTDFSKKITSSSLGENIEKQFGSRLNLTKYNREQLEDYRNKLRTRVFQQENNSKFNDLLTNETYQKDKAMLELLNTRIKEMLGEDIKKLRDKMDELSEAKKGVRDIKHAKKTKGSKPDFLDLNHNGNKTEPMAKAAKDSKMKEAIKKDEKELEGNAFGNAVRNAKKDGVQPGEKIKVGGKEYPVKEEADQDTSSKFNKKKVSTGTQFTKKDKEFDKDAGDNGGKHDASHLQDLLGKKPKNDVKGRVHKMKESKCNECGMYESKCKCATMESTGDYSAKKAAAGKDIGKPGKNFAKIAKKSGGGEKGERIAGAVLKKLRAKESITQFRHNVRFINESLNFLLSEDEEGKAKAITAAGDIVNDYTSWMQRVGQYQTKTMIELADAIKADFGAQEAEQFKQSVGPALTATLETLTQQREAISNAVAVLAGEAAPSEPMGSEPGLDLEPGMDMSAPDEMNPGADLGDEFSAADAASGDGTSGREMRESVEQRRARKIAESHSIIAKLAK